MNKIKIFRKKLSLTIRELAEKTGVAVGYLSDLENNNKTNPSRKVMKEISNALGATISDVFFSDDEELKEAN